jgi:hypothetical protein
LIWLNKEKGNGADQGESFLTIPAAILCLSTEMLKTIEITSSYDDFFSNAFYAYVLRFYDVFSFYHKA